MAPLHTCSREQVLLPLDLSTAPPHPHPAQAGPADEAAEAADAEAGGLLQWLRSDAWREEDGGGDGGDGDGGDGGDGGGDGGGGGGGDGSGGSGGGSSSARGGGCSGGGGSSVPTTSALSDSRADPS